MFFAMLQINDMSTLSWSTRIKGFCICFVVGIVFSFLGALALFLHSGIVVFGVFYTLGNIISMARYNFNLFIFFFLHIFLNLHFFSNNSTCFLMGPFNQMKKMFSNTRLIATCLVIFSLVMTLVAALVVGCRLYFMLKYFIFF